MPKDPLVNDDFAASTAQKQSQIIWFNGVDSIGTYRKMADK